MTTTLIQPNGQNFYLTEWETPRSERFRRKANSLSGGWGGWGHGHDPDVVLASRPSRVRSFIKSRIPFDIERNSTLILDFEHRIHPMRLDRDIDPVDQLRILMAQRVFYDTFRDEVDSNVDLLPWMGGRTMQLEMSDIDQFRLDHFEIAAQAGVLNSCQGVTLRCFPKGGSTHDQWWKLPAYIRNNVQAHREIADRHLGPDFRIMVQLSFVAMETQEQLSATDLVELVGHCEDAGCHDIGIWHHTRDILPGHRPLYKVLFEMDELLDERGRPTNNNTGRNG